MLLVAVVDQRVEAVHGLDPHIAALAAVAAIGAAHLDELFPTEGHRTSSAVTGAHINLCLVEEFHDVALYRVGRKPPSPLWRIRHGSRSMLQCNNFAPLRTHLAVLREPAPIWVAIRGR
jgi:hypothetical protein